MFSNFQLRTNDLHKYIYNSLLKVQGIKEAHVIATEFSLRFHKALIYHGQFSDIEVLMELRFA